MMVAVLALDEHAATHNSVEELLELGRLISNQPV